MTDQNNALATIEQIESQLANMAAFDLDTIGAQLGALYSEAEQRGDIQAVQRTGWLWDMAQQQHAALTTASNIAHTAANLAKTHAAQRDAALKEFQELADAVDTADYDNERVASLIEMVEENAFNYAVDSFDLCINEPGVTMCDGVFSDLLPRAKGIDDPQLKLNSEAIQACHDFSKFLFQTQAHEAGEELRRKVLDFIKEVHPLIQQEHAALIERQKAEFDYWKTEAGRRQIQRELHDHFTGDSTDTDDEDLDVDA